MSHIRGRFNKAADKLVAAYTESISYDWRLYRQDITGSIVHARMLAKQGIISSEEAEVIADGLTSIRGEIENGTFDFKTELEDIHMAIEARLIDMTGDAGRKLHTARSRNDQVALDLRLYAKEAIKETVTDLKKLQLALVELAENNKDVVVPGYTHMQPAQPVLLAHHLLAYVEMLQRDVERFETCVYHTDVMPLGSGALAGVAYDIDRDFLARELGFSRISRNSMDAVSDRDFVVEYEAAASLGMMHISRLSEEIVIWSSAEFAFIELDDAYTTGSSIMPQKKNPDVAELARGKTGRVYGRLIAMLTTMKALPLAYKGFFDTVDTLLSTLSVFTGMVGTIRVNREKTMEAVARGYLLATEFADYLAKKGEAFRTAHNVVGRLVSYAIKQGKPLCDISMKEYKSFSSLFDDDVYDITPGSSLAARDVSGGTAPGQVERALDSALKMIGKV